MKLNKRGKLVLAIAAGAVAAGLVAATAVVVVQQVSADAEARAAFDTAEEELTSALVARDAAHISARAALEDARTARDSAVRLHAAATPTLLAEAGPRELLQTAIDELVAVAALRVDAGGTVLLPALPPKSAVPEPAAPEGRDALLEAARQLQAEAVPLREQAEMLQQRTGEIESARFALHEAELAVLASAQEKGTATPAPELASDETKAAYAAAVAALAEPAPDADLAALMTAYAAAWSAATASHEEAVRQRDAASVEPTYINGILVVNKTYALPSWFGDGLTSETLAAFEAMRAEAAAAGHSLYISSGFRSYWDQQAIYNRYVAADGQAEADRYSARPGHSEHQSGLTFDLNCICESFGHQADGLWVRDNAHLFGFVVRYPQGKEAITGYIWEPWHLRYLGVSVATELYSSGLTLEEYLGITSSYD